MSTQVDQFIHEHLPAASAMPQLIFERPELQFPEQLNAAVELLDRRVAAGHGARILLRDARGALTYAQVLDRVNQFGRVLIEDMQLVTGNRVLLRGGNSIAMAIAWLAVVKVGLIAVATMPMLRARELTDVIRKGRISHALCVDALTEELFLAQQQCPTLANITTLESLQRIAASKSTDCPLRKRRTTILH